MSKPRKPRLALPFTVLTGPDRVRLIAGEDFRYTLEGAGLETWLPALLARMDGTFSLAELTGALAGERRTAFLEVIDQLYGERVLVDGAAAQAHPARPFRLAIEGEGPLTSLLESGPPVEAGGPALAVLCQDRLDPGGALEFNREQLAGDAPWLWATTGPMKRGYVSPPFLPDAGPCLACLMGHFERLSPVPELYGELAEHAARGGAMPALPFPGEALAVMASLVRWKAASLAVAAPAAALYDLHVLEVDTMEVSTHRVFRDPECTACRRR